MCIYIYFIKFSWKVDGKAGKHIHNIRDSFECAESKYLQQLLLHYGLFVASMVLMSQVCL